MQNAIITSDMGIGPRDEPPRTADAGTGPAGPATAAKDAQRLRWIQAAFVEARAGEIVAAVEGGALGREMKRQWRRWLTNSEKHWPFVERRKARKAK